MMIMFHEWLSEKIGEKYPGIPFEIETPPDEKMGDFSLNIAFALAKKLKVSPLQIAKEIAGALAADREFDARFSRIEEAPPGFVNFFVRQAFLHRMLPRIFRAGKTYGRGKQGLGKTIIVEYPSTNVAKPMHIGHSRTAFIGDALARIYEYLGYNVVRWDHIGDWGTQFGKLLAAYKLWGKKEDVVREPLEALLALYVRFNSEEKEKPELAEMAREEFHKLEEGNAENKKLWQWFKDESLREAHQTYRRLGLLPAHRQIGESFYVSQLHDIVADLLACKIAEKSDGAVVIKFPSENMPPALVLKTDGSSLYLTRDIASLLYRMKIIRPDKILYVVANQQALHLAQLFAAARLMGIRDTELVHVKFGMVLGEDGKKLATREGKIIGLQTVIHESTERVRKIAQDKNFGLTEAELDKVAHVVGVGALKYNDLKEFRTSDITFNWDRMLDLSGNSGPYLQYTYARLKNILRKAGLGVRILRRFWHGDAETLREATELRLIKKVSEFPQAVIRSGETYATNGLALYLYELANLTSRYYEEIRILGDKNKKRLLARLMLIETVARILKSGLNLLGLQAPERV